MNSIEKTLIKLFGGKDVDTYLGHDTPTKQSQQKETSNSSIFKSFGNLLKNTVEGVFDPILYPFMYLKRKKEKQRQEEVERQMKKAKMLNKIANSYRTNRYTLNSNNSKDNHSNNIGSQSVIDRSQYDKMAKQVWDDNIDRPGLDVGREYLQNIKKSLVRQQVQPSQITETLFRDTFRKKNFSENNITILWSEYTTWIRSYKSSYHGRYNIQ